MKEITISDKQVIIKATPLALLYYKQEFNSDLVGDMAKLQDIDKNPSQFNSVVLLQMIWAMAKAGAGPGNKFPPFVGWLTDMESIDFADNEMIIAVMDEAADGFFRGAKPGQGKGKRKTN